MITLYNKTESNFNRNGLAVLDWNIVSPVISEELNGLFSFEFDYPIHAPHSDELMPEMIVKAPIPELSDQLFRIVERDDTLGGFLHIVAHHIFYDLATNFIEDTYIVNKNGSGVLTQLLGATQFTHRFTGTSNITRVSNVRLVRLNPMEVLLDGDLENGFQSRYGGEIVRDNFTISMLTTRGSNNGVQIRDKKNLTGYKADVDYSSIVTRIMSQGYDGLFLPEKYVDSPNINQYVQPKIKVVKYDNVKVGEEEDEFATPKLAYALTVHKSQGSGLGKIIVVINGANSFVTKELLYTAFSRQKEKLIILRDLSVDELIQYSNDWYSDTKQRYTDDSENIEAIITEWTGS